jgi:hypothetical protein
METTMLLGLGIGLSFFGIGFMCWLLFSLAIYALPCFVGMWAFMTSYHTGAGPLGAIALGLIAGALTVGVGHLAFGLIRIPAIRAAIALAFALPAAIAGYSVTVGLATIGVPSHGWITAFGIVGGFMVGVAAWTRLIIGSQPVTGQNGGTSQTPLTVALPAPVRQPPARRAY